MNKNNLMPILGICGLLLAGGSAMAEGMNWESPDVKAKVDAKVAQVDQAVTRGPYRNDWDSLRTYQIPDWYRDAKFGIFIHWGLYSVPSFANEWYSRNMYQKDSAEYKHQVATYGPLTKFGYKDFAPLFKAKKFDPAAWIGTFKDAGAKYVVPVAEHHDGFAMYDSDFSDWTAVKKGPKRDIIGLLAGEARKQGLLFGLSSHRAEHWWFMNGGMKFPSDVQDPQYSDFYGPAAPDDTTPDEAYLRNWLARASELADKYHPQVMYFDWWIGEKDVFKPYLREFTAYLYDQAAKEKRVPVLATKDKAYVAGTAVMDVERGGLPDIRTEPWQTDTAISWGSWCYIENDHYKSSALLLRTLIDAVSKNGNLLLDIGPKPDGTLPEESVKVLREMGAWLKVNGETIFGTRPWIAYGEGPTKEKVGKFNESDTAYQQGDLRFTRKGDKLNVITLVGPTQPVTVSLLGPRAAPVLEVLGVRLLGSSEKVDWKREAAGLILPPPSKKGPDPVAYQVTLDGSCQGRLSLGLKGLRVSAQWVVQNFSSQPLDREYSLRTGGQTVATQKVSVDPGAEKVVQASFEAPRAALVGISVESKGVPALTGQAALPAIDLTGEWLFKKGDDLKWKDPDSRDSDWEKVQLPDTWEHHSNYYGDNDYGWYRRTVLIPAEWKGHDLVIPLGKIDDTDESYLNGHSIGKTGEFPPKFQGQWNQLRAYPVPAKWVRFGEPNVIAIRVFNGTGNAGLYDGPLGPIEVK